ncbi:MAG: hypothetical protein LM560_04665 [Desulfurococcaceae archaeon]|nr:hypothetical protein [Desulfurococcaceae archaeon]
MRLRVSIHPVTGFISVVWVLTSLYMGYVLSAFVLSLILTMLLVMSKGVKEVVNLLKLYTWLVIPPFIILTIMYTPLEALDMSIRLLTIALVFTNVLQLITPLELTYTLMRLRIPATASLAIPMVIRLSEYMGYIVNEALIALRGRGLRRRKLLMSLPIPLVVHTIKSSTQLAEALTQKTFRNVNLVLGKPKVGLTDTLIYLYIVLMTLKYLLFKYV